MGVLHWSRYGTNAFARVINIITRSPIVNDSEQWVSFSYANFGTYATEGGLTFGNDELSLVLGFKYLDSEGERYRYTDGDNITLNPEWIEKNKGLYFEVHGILPFKPKLQAKPSWATIILMDHAEPCVIGQRLDIFRIENIVDKK